MPHHPMAELAHWLICAQVAPKTAENFGRCARARRLRLQGLLLPPRDSEVHVPGRRLHESQRHGRQVIYGAKFADENSSSATTAPASSRWPTRARARTPAFFLCTALTSWLDGKHVVFGQVVEGYGVVKAMNVGSSSGKTAASRSDCGQC